MLKVEPSEQEARKVAGKQNTCCPVALGCSKLVHRFKFGCDCSWALS